MKSASRRLGGRDRQTLAACALSTLGAWLGSGTAVAGPGALQVVAPVTLDRFNYAFSDATGTRSTLPTYTALGSGFAGFDDRDAQVLLGFTTSALIEPAPPSAYEIHSAAVVLFVSMEEGQPSFIYDPTYDAAATYVPGGAVPDADAGRPVELFAAGYRAGYTSATFMENSPYATEPPVVPPARGNRNVYPIDFGGTAGAARDVSNNITDFTGAPAPFDVFPLAIGRVAGVAPANFQEPYATGAAPGEPVAHRTRMRFEIDLDAPGARAYLAQSLSEGRVNFIVDSISPATAFGGGPITYPVFFSKENPLGRAATLELNVTLGGLGACNLADVSEVGGSEEAPGAPDGQLTVDDLIVFVNSYSSASGCPGTAPCNRADVTGVGGSGTAPDGELTVDDLIEFVNAFIEGC